MSRVGAPVSEQVIGVCSSAVSKFGSVAIAGGAFFMGTDDDRFPAGLEGAVREVQVDAFTASTTVVTNREFTRFVDAPGSTTSPSTRSCR